MNLPYSQNTGWIKLFSTEHIHQAQLTKETLEQNGISAVILNQRDTSYNNFGMYIVMVLKENAENAHELLFSLDT